MGVRVVVFNATFSYIMVVSFIGGGNRNTWRKPPTCHKSLTTLPHIAVSSTPCHERDSNFSGDSTDCIDSCKSNYHTITTRVLRLRCLTPLSTILAFKHHNPNPTPHCITTMTATYMMKNKGDGINY